MLDSLIRVSSVKTWLFYIGVNLLKSWLFYIRVNLGSGAVLTLLWYLRVVILDTTARLPMTPPNLTLIKLSVMSFLFFFFFFFLSVSVPILCRIDMTSNKVNWSDMDLNSHIFRHSVYPGAVCPLPIHLKMANIIHLVPIMQKLSNTPKS